MAKLIALIFLFSALLISHSAARSPISTQEDASATNLTPAAFSEEDVSDLKSLIALPTIDTLPDSNPAQIETALPIEDGLRPVTRRFERLRAFRCRHGHRGGRFGADHRHGRLHGEIDSAITGGPGVDENGRMIGEFKEPHFFFRHHHHHHHHDDEEEHDHHDHHGEDEEHHHDHHHGEDEEEHHRHHHGEEEEHHHHHHHGFWRMMRNFMGHY